MGVSQTPWRVLIAEDEALIRLDLKEMLEEEGYSVVGEASDGQQAIDLRGNIRELNSSGFQRLDRDAIIACNNALWSFSENSGTTLRESPWSNGNPCSRLLHWLTHSNSH